MYIEVAYKESGLDSRGSAAKNEIQADLGIEGIEAISYVEVYRFEGSLTKKDLSRIAEDLVSDPLTQEYSINSPLKEDGFDWEITVEFHPDVTDNIGMTAEEGVRELLGKKFKGSVRTAKKYVITGEIAEKEVKRICTDLLANPAIESYAYRMGA